MFRVSHANSDDIRILTCDAMYFLDLGNPCDELRCVGLLRNCLKKNESYHVVSISHRVAQTLVCIRGSESDPKKNRLKSVLLLDQRSQPISAHGSALFLELQQLRLHY